jgi:hypothetical protein
MRRIFQLVAVAAILLTSASAQSNRLAGVWRLIDVTTTGPNSSTNSSPQPNQYIFTKKHYSIVSVTAKEPRPVTEVATATADELRAVFGSGFAANSGTYEVKGDLLTLRPHVAKNPGFMQDGNFAVSKFKIEGDVLTMVSHSNREGPVANPTTTRLKRVE